MITITLRQTSGGHAVQANRRESKECILAVSKYIQYAANHLVAIAATDP
jgi:hypothetical protein